MNKRKIAAMLLLKMLTANPVYGQDARITTEVMASSNPDERGVSRTIGSYSGREFKLFGMFEAALKRPQKGGEPRGGPDYFLLLAGHRELKKGIELVAEGTKARGGPADLGIGLGYDVHMPKGAYLNPHVLPLNFTANGVARRSEVELLGGYEKNRYYADGRMQLSIPYHQRRECVAELAMGKKLGRFAGEVSVAHNSRGNAVRGDLKYGVYGK